MSKVEANRGQFQKGKAKTGGRKKGTPNKRTKELAEVLGSFDPADKLVQIYNETDDLDLKAQICRDLLKYVYPQRKAVEMSADVDINNEPFEVRFI